MDQRQKRTLVVKLLATSAKDILVIKIFSAKAKNAKDFLRIFQGFTMRAIATSNDISDSQKLEFKKKLTEEQWQSIVNGGMVETAVMLHAFGFTIDEIVAAIPAMESPLERSIVEAYKIYLSEIKNKSNKTEVDLPFVVANEKQYENLDSAAKALSQASS
jgi:hypothetical protein